MRGVRGTLGRPGRTALAAVALLLSGCAFSPQLQRVAVDHDEMVAQTEDELMLRNIMRARFRYPLHFTSILEVSGDAQLSVGGSLGASFPGTSASRSFSAAGALTGSSASDGATSFSPGLNGGISTRPGFRAAVLANEKFQRGLQQPVRPELIAYYLDAGWRDELLIGLFVERIDIVDAGRQRLASVYNDPNDAYGFQAVVCNFAFKTQRIEGRRPLARIDQVFNAEDLARLDQRDRAAALQSYVDLLRDDKVGLGEDALTYKTNTNYSITFVRTHDRCAGADHSASKQSWRRLNPAVGLAPGEIRSGLPVMTGQALLDPARFDFDQASTTPSGGIQLRYLRPGEAPQTASLEVHFRSVQDVIYFLGEYVRAGKAAYQIPREYFFTQCGATAAAPVRRMRWIFDVRDGGAGAVRTSFLGKRYAIPDEDVEGHERCGVPGGESSRSLQVLSLMQQLLNLNKSADQLPTSISITAAP